MPVVHGEGKAAILASVFGDERDVRQVAGPARAARGRDLVPRSGGGRAAAALTTASLDGHEPVRRRAHVRARLARRRRARRLSRSCRRRTRARRRLGSRPRGRRWRRRPGPAGPPARPRRDGRPHDLADRSALPSPATRRRSRSTAAGGAHRATRRRTPSSASTRTSPPRPRRSPPRRAGRSTSPGHSYGGRVGLGASLLTPAIRRLVVYEGAPVPAGMSYRPPGMVEAVRDGARTRRQRGRARRRSSPGSSACPRRPSTPTAPIPSGRPASRRRRRSCARSRRRRPPPLPSTRSGAVSVPVLLVLGSISRSPFRIGTDELAARLANARVVTIRALRTPRTTPTPRSSSARSSPSSTPGGLNPLVDSVA